MLDGYDPYYNPSSSCFSDKIFTADGADIADSRGNIPIFIREIRVIRGKDSFLSRGFAAPGHPWLLLNSYE